MAPRVFLNYRREDTSGHAGRLYDALAERFGADHVFMDVDTIRLGSDFTEAIEGAVKQCDVLVALMGRHWLDAEAPDGRRRLDDPDDFVRLELESALANGVQIVPAAVQGASFPGPSDLPPSLEPIARRQGIELRDSAWHDDTSRLIRRLEQPDAAETALPRSRRRLLWIGLALVAVAAVAGVLALVLRGGGGSSGNTPADPRLLSAVPASVRSTCHAISFGAESATASAECEASNVSATYNLFSSRDTTDGWYVQQREQVGILPGSGSCTPSSFRGEVTDSGGRYFCYVDSQGEPTIIWTQSGANVGAAAGAYDMTGSTAAASLLRQWRCCLRGP